MSDHVSIPVDDHHGPRPPRVAPWRRWVVQWDISHLAVPLAFIAFSAMWKTASHYMHMPSIAHLMYIIFFYIALAVLILTLLPLILRAIIFPTSILSDFRHPHLMNFFFMPVMISSLFVISLPNNPSQHVYEITFYIIGVYQLILALYMFGEWLFTTKQTLPVDFIHPLVFMQTIGFFLTANIAVRAHLFEQATGMLYIGVLFWLLVFISIFQHVSKSTPQQKYATSPTFFLFLAPPAQAALTFVLLDQLSNPSPPLEPAPWPQIAQAFLYIDLFLYALVARVFLTLWTSKFSVAFWAYIFPLSAASALIMCKYFNTPTTFWKVLSFIAGMIACIAMLVVFVCMTKSLLNGETPSNPTALQNYMKFLSGQNPVLKTSNHRPSAEQQQQQQDSKADAVVVIEKSGDGQSTNSNTLSTST